MLLFADVIICENSNKLGRATSQSKVENKTAPYRTAAMLFTATLDLEARRKAKEASKARRRKIRRRSETATTDETNHHSSFCSITHCNYFKQPTTRQPTTRPDFVQSRTVITSNNPKGVV